jgi:DNA-directed RNA polymerase subunit D
MDLILEKKHENRIEFSAKDLVPSFANAIRRYSMAKVPVLAIDRVTVYDNTSSFWDEYVAYRIGLMPVTTPKKTPKSAEIIFSLDAEGPKKIYSGELQSSDKGIKIALDNIPVITLAQDQRIRLEGKAILKNAMEHAKFQAGIVSYGIKEDGTFKFTVESFYQMPPKDVVERGCDEVINDIEEIEKALKKKK